MPQATREIKRRIRSIKSTRQITKAMELVSAAKMRRAVANTLMSRSYSDLAWQLVLELKRRVSEAEQPLLTPRENIKRVAVLVVSSNRGLCGGFNNQLTHKVINYIKQSLQAEAKPEAVELVTLGKRGRDILLRQGFNLAAEFVKQDITTKLSEILPVVELLINDYLSGRYDKVVLAYTDFISPLVQKPRLKQLLPIDLTPDPYLGVSQSKPPAAPEVKHNFGEYEYLFEPSTSEVLGELLPRLLEVQIYQAVLESDAAEHSARMMSMRNASEAAKDMVDALTLAFNQARQASITSELADITGGRAAVGG
ncbi:MAG: ATP synthase F1 subunit gamma [Candidatus Kerfeldbacteria bacterium]|nr:ATP synthase F1 subunit gamma [Candidatus Kerfeldbacteria bacterium]